MTRTGLTWLTAVLAGGALVGCKETTSSCNIRTPGIAELTTVTARSGDQSTVHTELRVGGDESNTYAILDCGDALFAEADGARETMTSQASGVYEAEFDVAAADTAFRVILERGQDDDAPNSTGSLPAPFEITSTFDGTPISRATEDVTITWDPSGTSDPMEVVVQEEGAGCIFRYDESVTDSGTHTIAAGTLDSTNDEEPETCNVTVTVRRMRAGQADSTFDNESYFNLQQVREVGFTSAP